MSSVAAERGSEAGGLQGTAMNLGASLGVALIGSILIASLVGVLVQDLYLFVLNGGAVAKAVPGAFVMQGIVLLISIGLVVLARNASARGWLS
jgi:hypothetical protein